MTTTAPPPPSTAPLSVLFVCLGNICKPPSLLPLPPSPNPFSPPQKPPRTNPPLPKTGRSPLAASILHHLTTTNPTSPHNPHHPPIRRITRIDSAGTAAYNLGARPDPRTISTLAAHGIPPPTHRARQIEAADFQEFDYILAMDAENLRDLRGMRERVRGGERGKAKVMLFGAFGGRGGEEEGEGEEGEEVEDPYYGGEEGFEVAFGQMVRFSEGFLREVGWK